MISIVYAVLAAILLLFPSLPLTSTKELRRPHSIYLGVGLLAGTGLLQLSLFAEPFSYILPGLIPIVVLIAALVLATPVVQTEEPSMQQKSSGARIVSLLTWVIVSVLLLGLSFIAFQVFFME